MSVTRMDFEGGVNGATVTSGGVSGFTQISLGSGTFVYDTTHAYHGSMATKLTPGASVATYGALTGWNTPQIAMELPVWIDTIPTADTWPMYFNDTSGSGVFRVYIDSAGKLRASIPGPTVVWTATNNFPLSQWVRVSVYGAIGAGTGTLKVSYFLGDSTTPVETGYASVGNLAMGSTNIDGVHIGKANGSTYASPFWIDGIQYDPAALDFIGPWPVFTQTTGAYVWNGTVWKRHIPYVWNGTSWDKYDAVE